MSGASTGGRSTPLIPSSSRAWEIAACPEVPALNTDFPRDARTDEIAELLRTTAATSFGFEELRLGQLEAMQAVLAGRDTLVVLPTGGGKSAIYQIPALLINGPTVV